MFVAFQANASTYQLIAKNFEWAPTNVSFEVWLGPQDVTPINYYVTQLVLNWVPTDITGVITATIENEFFPGAIKVQENKYVHAFTNDPVNPGGPIVLNTLTKICKIHLSTTGQITTRVLKWVNSGVLTLRTKVFTKTNGVTSDITDTTGHLIDLTVGVTTPSVTTLIKVFNVEQNYPNPFNPSTTINYTIPKSGLVSLKVYDLLGSEVASLVNEVKNAGFYTVDFNASALSSGVYFLKTNFEGYTDIKTLTLIK